MCVCVDVCACACVCVCVGAGWRCCWKWPRRLTLRSFCSLTSFGLFLFLVPSLLFSPALPPSHLSLFLLPHFYQQSRSSRALGRPLAQPHSLSLSLSFSLFLSLRLFSAFCHPRAMEQHSPRAEGLTATERWIRLRVGLNDAPPEILCKSGASFSFSLSLSLSLFLFLVLSLWRLPSSPSRAFDCFL